MFHVIFYCPLSTAVQNERQPRNTAQVREDQIEQELEHPLVPSNATVSATHPAFSPGTGVAGVTTPLAHPAHLAHSGHRFMAMITAGDGTTSAKNDSDDAGKTTRAITVFISCS